MGAFDIQVNGYGGVDFNQDDLRPEDLRRACDALARDGVEGILATIITEDFDKMTLRIRQIVRMRESDEVIRGMVAGIHVEGPFISPEAGYRGAHPPMPSDGPIRPWPPGCLRQERATSAS